MAESMYSTFKKYILFEEPFMFITSLYFIFNEENEIKSIDNNKIEFVMSYKKFKNYLNKLKKDASRSCGVVCTLDNNCSGHQVLKMMQDYDDFLFDSVERKADFYKSVKFVKLINNNNDNDPMFGFKIYPFDYVDLGWKTWSQRLSYLRI